MLQPSGDSKSRRYLGTSVKVAEILCPAMSQGYKMPLTSKKVQITKSKFVAKVRDVLRSAGYPEDQFVSQFPHRCSNYRSNGGDRRLDDPNSRTLAQHSVLTVYKSAILLKMLCKYFGYSCSQKSSIFNLWKCNELVNPITGCLRSSLASADYSRAVSLTGRVTCLYSVFSGESQNWTEWAEHFESVVTVNKWDSDDDKLKWLKVRLTGKARTAFQKLPADIRNKYARSSCMWQNFTPGRDIDALRVLADKAYSDLEEKAHVRFVALINANCSTLKSNRLGITRRRYMGNILFFPVSRNLQAVVSAGLMLVGKKLVMKKLEVNYSDSTGTFGNGPRAERLSNVGVTGEALGITC
eukprot:Em0025g85a